MNLGKKSLLVVASLLLSPLGSAADPDPISDQRFVKVTEPGGKEVVAVRLAPPSGADPGFVAWLEPTGAIKVGPGASVALGPGARSEETALASKKIGARLVVHWGSNEVQNGIFKTNRTTKVDFFDKRDEIEMYVVLLAPEGTEKELRGALCFRVLRGEKVIDTGSAVFSVTEGKPKKVSVPSKGPSLSVLVDVPGEG
ncbi:MAG TPA: hypothetical protein VGR00_07460 [Thermoanaerobaculia bacterium]|jgi:hypothetical protein|nr:hypothetical protein [Thermoanaerobaculia bacterium]